MTDDEARRKRQRRIWIRVAIYVPLLAYFGWGAYAKYRAERDAAPPSTVDIPRDAAADPFEGLPTTEMTMPDGRTVRVLELTPEQAEKMGLAPPDPPSMAAGDTSSDTDAPATTGDEPDTTGEAVPAPAANEE